MTNTPVAANDNGKRRGATKWPLNELYNRGELGVSEPENYRHWQAALRFRRHYASTLEPIADGVPDSVADEWRALVPGISTTSEAAVITTLGENDGPLQLSDDMDWVDHGAAGLSEVFDYSGFNVFRDLPTAAQEIEHKQVVALAADVLGGSYQVVVALVVNKFNLQELGETEGLTDPASSRACGKGIMRAALRDLAAFFMKLDRMESDGIALRAVWPLVGTPDWRYADMPDMRWKRKDIAPADHFDGLVYVAA